MRTVPWFVTVEVDRYQKKYCVWSQTEASATRKAILRYKKDNEDNFPMKVGKSMITVCWRIFKKEADEWKGTTLR